MINNIQQHLQQLIQYMIYHNLEHNNLNQNYKADLRFTYNSKINLTLLIMIIYYNSHLKGILLQIN